MYLPVGRNYYTEQLAQLLLHDMYDSCNECAFQFRKHFLRRSNDAVFSNFAAAPARALAHSIASRGPRPGPRSVGLLSNCRLSTIITR